MKGTRLWQEAGSPIIRGRSRTLRPFWQPWLGATVGAFVFTLAVLWASTNGLRAAPSVAGVVLLGRDAAFALPGVVIGAAVGVWIARKANWRVAWLYGAVFGTVFAVLSAWLLGRH